MMPMSDGAGTPAIPIAAELAVSRAELDAHGGDSSWSPSWSGDVADLARRFATASPFPHLVFDSFLAPARAVAVAAAFPRANPSWIRFTHLNERKYGNPTISTFPEPLRDLARELSSPAFLRWLGQVTGLEGLRADPELCGGGLHQTPPGGFLNIHSDFSSHPRHPSWRRSVNLVLFLNPDWDDAYGGQLELWPPSMANCAVKVPPRLNTCVIFRVGRGTCHGHPDPLRCPPDRTRNSLALYYFTEDEQAPRRATTYYPRPGDGARALLIHAENLALRVFDKVRRRGLLTDETVSRLLGVFDR